MFYIGSEVVVIGSNIKRKSGPRVGSIGNVLYGQSYTQQGNTAMKPFVVGFSRYGYEKKERLEIKKVYVNSFSNIDNLFEGKKNFRKLINKFVKQTENSEFTAAPLLVLAPVNDFISVNSANTNRIIAYIVSNVKNPIISTQLKFLLHKTSKDYTTLRKSVSNKTLRAIGPIISSNLNNMRYRINSLLSCDIEATKEFLTLINTIKALVIRNIGQSEPGEYVPHYLLNNEFYKRKQLFECMFMPHLYAKKKKECEEKEFNVTNIEGLKQAALKKGKLVYTAY